MERQDVARLLQMIMGNGSPNPYIGLDLRNQLQNRWDNWAQQYLPQAPGMQQVMFQSLEDLPAIQREAYRRY